MKTKSILSDGPSAKEQREAMEARVASRNAAHAYSPSHNLGGLCSVCFNGPSHPNHSCLTLPPKTEFSASRVRKEWTAVDASTGDTFRTTDTEIKRRVSRLSRSEKSERRVVVTGAVFSKLSISQP